MVRNAALIFKSSSNSSDIPNDKFVRAGLAVETTAPGPVPEHEGIDTTQKEAPVTAPGRLRTCGQEKK